MRSLLSLLLFCGEEGIMLTCQNRNELLYNILGELLGEHPSLFLADAKKSRADVEEKHDVYSSFRWGSNT
jgi:hypothetical protein